MAIAQQQQRVPSTTFTSVGRGYDRDEVYEHIERSESELRAIAAERDSAAELAQSLSNQLEDARSEIENLRKQADRLSTMPKSMDGMSVRISRMMQLAADEAAEVRALAQAEAAETVSAAEQNAATIRGEYTSRLAEAEEQRDALEVECEQTVASMRTESQRIVAAAESNADRLTVAAEAKRESTQKAFDESLNDRRTKLTHALGELERTTKAGAQKRLADAATDSKRTLQLATQRSERALAEAAEMAEELRLLRGRILAQLLGIRGQLDSVPALLATGNREGELFEGDAEEASATARKASVNGARQAG